ncbi:MAG: hypothetical protein N3G76_02265, partial [Candidatus Micrarchaeota archaeon]|nr:hypothetical protein [Candidatus Micrarchaeota archaeon]
RKMMSTVHKVGNSKVAYVKGAPEVILSRSTHIFRDGRPKRISRKDIEEIRKTLEIFGKGSLRVLAIAYKELGKASHTCDVEMGLVFYGLVGMIDPLREG